MEEFFQDPPILKNQYEDDLLLRSYLKRQLPEKILKEIEPDLYRMGERAVTDIMELGRQAEATPPKHVPYDAWGRRIDEIEVSEAWKELDRISAQEGLVAIGYERKYGAFSRIYQFAKIYLFGSSSAVYTCPLAMTDGAARAIELHGDEKLRKQTLPHLLSRDPKEFWTSGQWMTERTGGSDVGGTSTTARLENGNYRLYGAKWFTSATTSQIAMTLARMEGAPTGSKGLSFFYLELRNKEGNLQNIHIHRLKDKLGTKALPTAELTLNGTPATLVGGPGDGVKKIASLFNITRIYNACCAVSFMRRGITLARDYASKRKAFGKLLQDHPLHRATLADLEMELQAAFYLTFRTVELLGKEEMNEAGPDEKACLRLLTPLVKLYTAKQAVSVISEVLECFGGAGYVEDTGLPKLLRDAQVLPIWEGTTNVLSLDALRAIEREEALEPFLNDIRNSPKKDEMGKALDLIESFWKKAREEGPEFREREARSFAFYLAQTCAASLLVRYESPLAQNWCQKRLNPTFLLK